MAEVYRFGGSDFLLICGVYQRTIFLYHAPPFKEHRPRLDSSAPHLIVLQKQRLKMAATLFPKLLIEYQRSPLWCVGYHPLLCSLALGAVKQLNVVVCGQISGNH